MNARAIGGHLLPAVVLAALGVLSGVLAAERIGVKHTEGVVHGFLTLHTLDGAWMADGDLIQSARGDRVTSQLVFRFKDGSVTDETAVYSQAREFQLVSDHLVQKGPTFPTQLDMTIDVPSGQVAVRYTNEHGEQRAETEQMQLPPDLANGMILTLLKNATPDNPPKNVSMVVATPKPRLVKVAITPQGKDRFSTNRTGREATHFALKIDIGGIAGLIAPLIGKQPPDAHVWILGGDAPAFVKSEQQMYMGGPVWRIELVSPGWPSPARK